MRKLILATALCGLSTVAFAADLPSRKAPPVYAPPPLPVFTWTGYYVGVTAGYAFDQDHTFNTVGNTPAQIGDIATGLRPAYIRDRSSGFTGGGEIGYNYQFPNTTYFGGGGVVIGVEADAAYVGPGANSIYTSGAFTSNFHSRTEFVGTARGRLGYAFNNVLIYGTGGFAYGGVDDNTSFFNAAGLNTFNGTRSTIKTGYAYGGGIAYAIPTTSFVNFMHSGAVTLKAEFIHYDLGTSSVLVPATTTGNSFTTRIKTEGNLVRAGLDYKIDFSGAPSAPILAKY
jgi:outer membrane immunogenic protein